MADEIAVSDMQKAKTLNDSILVYRAVIEENFMLLAGTLREMLDGEYYKLLGHENLDGYSASLGMSKRTVEYFASIDRRFRELGIEPAGLTWTKAREILPIINEKNKEEWIEKAKTMPIRELIEEVKAHKKERGIKDIRPVGHVPIPFYNEEDGKEMLEHLELAGKVTGSDRRDVQFLAMCWEFRAEYSHKAEEGIEDKVKKEIMECDGYKCRVPWCRRRTNLSVHEIIFKSHMGKVGKENSVTLCLRCHGLVHDGRLGIEKTDKEGRLKFIGRKINFANDKIEEKKAE